MHFVLLTCIGLLVGTIVILFGGGGGAIYLGILTGGFGIPAAAAAATSLITSLSSLMIGAWRYHQQGQIQTRIGTQMLIPAIPAVIIGVMLSKFIPTPVYSWLIAIVLVALGVGMLSQKSKQKGPNTTDPHVRVKAGAYGIIAGLMVGVAGMSGGGIILGGLFLLGLSGFDATATSAYVLVFMNIVGSLFHIGSGQVAWSVGLPLMIGAMLGALIAPQLALRLRNTKVAVYMKPVMAVLLIILGIKSVF
ncbi:sulfite exporter TauE/SafE family protein [Lacticaseibacillus zhaodongensis]|uniref:sulfite exporter TauE/SafE family protein n=1 Tax=Lacticaseibacillus zhaodongensis TaxID=2668065 RepID=UPI0012D2D81C|nr:sulfite exporter TauE/SafE family protein [Lacticaseibacillus zhaodongensis]